MAYITKIKMTNKKPLLIALDMDGTLLNDKKKICPKTLLLLRKLTKGGHKVVLSSGRPVRALLPYYKSLRLNTPIICYNGARVCSPNDPNFKTFSLPFKKEMMIDILKSMGSELESFMCETDDEIWIDKEDKFLDVFFYYKGMNVHKGKIEDILDKDTFTCICKTSWEYRDTKEFKELFKKYKDTFAIKWIGSPYFEFHHYGTSKGDSIKYIAKYYDIPKENIISFGDSTNDVELFDESGTAILMCNSKKEIKNITRRSTRDNNHDGIYYELKEILKQY